MEGEVCPYRKFGYCKYKEECKRKHLEEVCDNLSNCKISKNVRKYILKPAIDFYLKRDAAFRKSVPITSR